MQIEVWSDVVCPWCFVGKRRLEAALGGFEHASDVEVTFRSFELDPTAPQHGHELTSVALARKLGRTEDETRDMQQQLIDLAASEGLEMRLHDNVHTNTVDAHRLLHLARETGGAALQRQLAQALFEAYFTRAEDIGDHDVLTQAAVGVGLDEARVREVLGSQEYAEAFEADVAQARAYGATGVPFFVVNRKYGVSGAQPVEVFSRLLDQAWSESHPTLQTVGGDADGACGPDGCAI